MSHILHARTAAWQHELQCAVSNVEDLLSYLELDDAADLGIQTSQHFPLKVPYSYLARIPKSDPRHPLLRQILPLAAENQHTVGFSRDPVGDLDAVVIPGVLQKYQGRVLLIATGACAIHCRYCFRRDFPYQTQNILPHFDEVLSHLTRDATIEEVILSGGDPLILNNRQLFYICEALEEIEHIRRIRIHTRLPICIPSRLDDEISAWLNDRRQSYIVVFHINHPDEIDAVVETSLKRLRRPLLLNQAVLLKGINDDAETLARLSTRCVDAGILPYYLHLLDPVAGTAHFEVSKEQAEQLIRALRRRLSGYLVPRLAQEKPGEMSKRILL